MAFWFDVGVNLTDQRLPVEETVQQDKAAGVNAMAITGTTVEHSKQGLALAKEYPDTLVTTAGVHPHYAAEVAADFVQQLSELAQHDEVVAIGECGLDFNRNFSPRDDQLRVFEDQLVLAADCRKPVFLHERDAFDEQIRLLRQYRPRLTGGVAHCFTGNVEQMQAYLDLDLYIGITGWVCDPKRGDALREAVRQLPLDRVVLETDAPYLLPKSLKSKSRTNYPANLPVVAQMVAELMNIEVSELQRHALTNTLNLFQLNSQHESLMNAG